MGASDVKFKNKEQGKPKPSESKTAHVKSAYSDDPSFSLGHLDLKDDSDKSEIAEMIASALGLKTSWDLRPMSIVLFTFSCLYLRWITYSKNESWFVFLATTAFDSLFCWYCATIVHNTIHSPMWPGQMTQGMNSLWNCVLCAAYGYPVSTLVPGHNLSHHRYTQGPKDVIRTTKMRWSYNLFNLLTFVFTVGPDIQVQDYSYFEFMRAKGMPIYYQAILEFVWLVVHQAAFIYYGGLRKWFVCIFIPQAFAKWGIITINLFQHDGCPNVDNDKYNFSRNFVDPTLNWFTCNNGYHTIHHHCPTIHWSKYPQLHEKNVKPHMNPMCDVPSIVWFIIETFFLPGGRKTYDGKPFHLGTPLFDELDVADEPWFDTSTLMKVANKTN